MLGDMWFQAAKALANGYPNAARTAGDWSMHYFERYAEAWTANLPASRFDSDGGAEMIELQELLVSLPQDQGSPAPDWVRFLLEGSWQDGLAALGGASPPEEFKPLVALLAKAGQDQRAGPTPS